LLPYKSNNTDEVADIIATFTIGVKMKHIIGKRTNKTVWLHLLGYLVRLDNYSYYFGHLVQYFTKLLRKIPKTIAIPFILNLILILLLHLLQFGIKK
jgi:hypothetical protein